MKRDSCCLCGQENRDDKIRYKWALKIRNIVNCKGIFINYDVFILFQIKGCFHWIYRSRQDYNASSRSFKFEKNCPWTRQGLFKLWMGQLGISFFKFKACNLSSALFRFFNGWHRHITYQISFMRWYSLKRHTNISVDQKLVNLKRKFWCVPLLQKTNI